jgi:hypothetical protein
MHIPFEMIQVQERVAHQLSGSVIGKVSAALDLKKLDAVFGELVLRNSQTPLSGRATSCDRRGMLA